MTSGFSYHLEDDKIKDYLKLSSEDKLKWLYEINLFNRIALDETDKEIQSKLKNS